MVAKNKKKVNSELSSTSVNVIFIFLKGLDTNLSFIYIKSIFIKFLKTIYQT